MGSDLSIILKSIYGEYFIGFYNSNKLCPMFDPLPYCAVEYKSLEEAEIDKAFLCSNGWEVRVKQEEIEDVG